MSSNVQRETDMKIEIQKTLMSINDVTLKIKKELDMINELVKENGPLRTAVTDANQTLTTVAKDMGIKTADLVNEDEDALRFNLPSAALPASLTEKLLSCIES